MKNSLLFFLPMVILSCQKADNYDYRNEYVGEYTFEISHSYPVSMWIDSLQTEVYFRKDSNYYYTGFIDKSTLLDDRITVIWGVGALASINGILYTQKNDMVVKPEGTLSYPEYYGGGNTIFHYDSWIKNDSIRFSFSSGGLGLYRTWKVLGVKNK